MPATRPVGADTEGSSDASGESPGIVGDEAPQLLLDNQLCFLFHRIGRDLTAVYRPLLSQLGLTYPQYLVMLVLWERDGLGVGEIGERVCLDSGTLSPLLRRLEGAGLVQRRREASDERRVTVSLTAEGRALRARAVRVPTDLAARVSDDGGQYQALHRQLSDLAARLESSLDR
jgi:MarR family transcriptional regulator, organic hydroperoxide resistance regulator